ncbi:hypothetical protein V6N12_007444 [Hibiscus sabdariffa]|uniref:DUF4283 domain-containing protein n=1 Tax=Hibiscus sabdariffa TaxID=183260 RepID=A0ABR2F1T2_9ROSI
MGILNNCAVGFSRKLYQISALAGFFRKAGLDGFSVMRIAGSSILLMFDEEGQRKEILESRVLNEWLENVRIWSSNMPIPNRRTWLSVSGIPIHAWSETTFENVARVWGDQSFPLRVTEIEEVIGPKCDCVCEVEDSQAASKSVSDGEEEERRHASVLEGTNGVTYSGETIVPNSIMSKTVNSIEMNRMWEGNKRVHWWVLEHDSGIGEEDIGMIQRDNEVCCSRMDLSEACRIQIDDQQILSKETNVGIPTGSGPKGRAKLSDVIEIDGQQRKVRQLSEILMSEGEGTDSLVCKIHAMKGVLKVWNRDSFGNVDDNYRELVDELEQLDTKQGGGELDDNDLSYKRDLISKFWKVSRLRESIWR